MPAKSPTLTKKSTEQLELLGRKIRQRRKALGVSATAAAESAGMSRVTLHRIENGGPSVTIGSYVNLMSALGLSLGVAVRSARGEDKPDGAGGEWIPARIDLIDYPQLKQLAWHIHGTNEISPLEAWGIYERNWRHLDLESLLPGERQLIEALRVAMGAG